jgi:transcriptional regulator of aromatic amino acid metabolism
MILRNVGALTTADQARLLVWLQHEGFGAQVVSTTEPPLFALVAKGLFDVALYYRLNVLLLRIAATNRPRVAQRLLPRLAEDALGAREDKSQG